MSNQKKNSTSNSSSSSRAIDDHRWIELCLDTGIPMRRSFFVIVAAAPYLLHHRNLSYEQAFSALQLFLWKSERLKPLNNPFIDHYEALIRYALARAQYYRHVKPISFKTLKHKEPVLYRYLMARSRSLIRFQ